MEGGADFLASYIESPEISARSSRLEQLASDTRCDEFDNIHQLNLAYRWGIRSVPRLCPYIMGERFLHALYVALGHDMVMGFLRERHRLSLSERDEELMYEQMLSHTPSGKEDEFQELYDHYHGRPRGYSPQSPTDATGERAALIALYNAAGGSNWVRQRLWLSDAPIAYWQASRLREPPPPGWDGMGRRGPQRRRHISQPS